MRASIAGRGQRGMGLIEVLVAMLVLAVGLLGMLTMQSRGLQLNQAAYYQSQAMFQAQDIIERIRANQEAILSYDLGLKESTDAKSGPCDDSSPCTAAELAAYDLHLWRTDLAAVLPGSTGGVTIGTPSGELYPVTVQVQFEQGETHTYQTETTL